MSTCPSCDQPAPRDATICRKCLSETRERLGDQGALRAELVVTMTRQARMSAQSDGGRSATTPLAYAEAASDALHEQRHVLVGWAKLCHDEIDQQWPRRDTIHAIAMHIESRLGDLRKHPAAGEMVAEIREMTAKGWEAVDCADDRHKVFVGQCPKPHGDEPCLGDLYLRKPWERDRKLGERVKVTCSSCGSIWYAEQFSTLGNRVPMNQEALEKLAAQISA